MNALRFALRLIRKNPGFAVAAVLPVALGIGATTALFSVLYAVLLRPLPFEGAERLVDFRLIEPSTPRPHALFLTARQLVTLQKADVLDGAIALDNWSMTLTGEGLPESINASYYSANALTFFGVRPLIGRVFTEADGPPGADPNRVVVLSYRFWQSHYGGRPEMLGQTINLNREPYTIIGVLPEEFRFEDVIVPIHLRFDPTFAWGAQARLKRGVSTKAAESALQSLLEEFAREAPNRFPREFRLQLASFVERRRSAPFVPALIFVFAASALLLLIACANVSILLLARGISRQHEFAVRSAIGASRRRLLRQLLTESLLSSLASAALGVLAAYGGLPIALRWISRSLLPIRPDSIHLDVPVLIFSVCAAMAAGLLFGLSPAFCFSRPETAPLLQGSSPKTAGTRRNRRTHYILITTQVAMTVLLLAGTVASVRTLLALYRTDLGYDPHNVLIANANLAENTYTRWPERTAFYDRLREQIARMPDVISVGMGVYTAVPPAAGARYRVEIEGQTGTADSSIFVERISPEYFSVFRIPILRGSVWPVSSAAHVPHVAVINQAMAKRYWPREDPLGQRVHVPSFAASTSQFVLAAPGSDGWFEIAGVVGDIRNAGLSDPPGPAMYVPYPLMLGDSATFVIRTTPNPSSIVRSLREQVSNVDSNQPLVAIRTAEEALDNQGWGREQSVAGLLFAFAVLALLLAVAGLYSVVNYYVSQRFKEFGIRAALGARRVDVVRLALGIPILSIGSGLVAGVALSLILNRVLARWSMGNMSDPAVLLWAGALLAGVGAAASVLPARRAASIEPVAALRE